MWVNNQTIYNCTSAVLMFVVHWAFGELETLNLYYNRLPSLQDIFSLHKLQKLKDTGLAAQSVVKKHPHYRCTWSTQWPNSASLVHDLSSLSVAVMIKQIRVLSVKCVLCSLSLQMTVQCETEKKGSSHAFLIRGNLDTNHKKHALIQEQRAGNDPISTRVIVI